jgi:hypothetical protein
VAAVAAAVLAAAVPDGALIPAPADEVLFSNALEMVVMIDLSLPNK